MPSRLLDQYIACTVTPNDQVTARRRFGRRSPSSDVEHMKELVARTFGLGWSSTLPVLPDELWANIFCLTLPDRPNFSTKESPTVLTHICRTWRRIALSYPLLWCRISLTASYDKLSNGTVELFRSWLDRSKKCPLDVDLRLPFDVLPWSIATNDEEFRVINEMLSLLYKHAHRLRTLLRGYPQILHRILQAEDLPLLELFIVSPPEGELCSFSVDTLPSSMKSFATFNTYIHFTPTTCWPKLEHLEIWQTSAFDGLSARDCLDILSQLPSLRAVSFHISVDDDESRNSFPTKVIMPSLRCLVISTFAEHNISLLFTKLSTPALEAIGVDGCNRRVLADSLPKFFRECSRSLKVSVFGQIGVVDVTFLAALTCVPSKSRVAICSSSFDGHVAARVGRARRAERGIEYADRWTGMGSPGHLLSLAYTSEEMWSDLQGREVDFRFPYWTYRDLNRWRPAAVLPEEQPDDKGVGPGSIKFSMCKGQSVSHTCLTECWLS